MDGQHRTLGFHLAWEELNDEIIKQRANLAAAKKSGAQALVKEFEARLGEVLDRRETLAAERVSVQSSSSSSPTRRAASSSTSTTTARASPEP